MARYAAEAQLPKPVVGWPWCVICGRPVKYVSINRVHVNSVAVTAFCHGEGDTIQLSEAAFNSAVLVQLCGDAFTLPAETEVREAPDKEKF